jgi:hypothetical protein
MLASALVAYIFGPTLGFTFAVVVGTLCGLAFAMSVVGRGAELESRVRVRLDPLVDRILDRIVHRIARRVAPMVAKVTARVRRTRLNPDEVIELGDLDLELGTNP